MKAMLAFVAILILMLVHHSSAACEAWQRDIGGTCTDPNWNVVTDPPTYNDKIVPVNLDGMALLYAPQVFELTLAPGEGILFSWIYRANWFAPVVFSQGLDKGLTTTIFAQAWEDDTFREEWNSGTPTDTHTPLPAKGSGNFKTGIVNWGTEPLTFDVTIAIPLYCVKGEPPASIEDVESIEEPVAWEERDSLFVCPLLKPPTANCEPWQRDIEGTCTDAKWTQNFTDPALDPKLNTEAEPGYFAYYTEEGSDLEIILQPGQGVMFMTTHRANWYWPLGAGWSMDPIPDVFTQIWEDDTFLAEWGSEDADGDYVFEAKGSGNFKIGYVNWGVAEVAFYAALEEWLYCIKSGDPYNDPSGYTDFEEIDSLFVCPLLGCAKWQRDIEDTCTDPKPIAASKEQLDALTITTQRDVNGETQDWPGYAYYFSTAEKYPTATLAPGEAFVVDFSDYRANFYNPWGHQWTDTPDIYTQIWEDYDSPNPIFHVEFPTDKTDAEDSAIGMQTAKGTGRWTILYVNWGSVTQTFAAHLKEYILCMTTPEDYDTSLPWMGADPYFCPMLKKCEAPSQYNSAGVCVNVIRIPPPPETTTATLFDDPRLNGAFPPYVALMQSSALGEEFSIAPQHGIEYEYTSWRGNFFLPCFNSTDEISADLIGEVWEDKVIFHGSMPAKELICGWEWGGSEGPMTVPAQASGLFALVVVNKGVAPAQFNPEFMNFRMGCVDGGTPGQYVEVDGIQVCSGFLPDSKKDARPIAQSKNFGVQWWSPSNPNSKHTRRSQTDKGSKAKATTKATTKAQAEEAECGDDTHFTTQFITEANMATCRPPVWSWGTARVVDDPSGVEIPPGLAILWPQEEETFFLPFQGYYFVAENYRAPFFLMLSQDKAEVRNEKGIVQVWEDDRIFHGEYTTNSTGLEFTQKGSGKWGIVFANMNDTATWQMIVSDWSIVRCADQSIPWNKESLPYVCATGTPPATHPATHPATPPATTPGVIIVPSTIPATPEIVLPDADLDVLFPGVVVQPGVNAGNGLASIEMIPTPLTDEQKAEHAKGDNVNKWYFQVSLPSTMTSPTHDVVLHLTSNNPRLVITPSIIRWVAGSNTTAVQGVTAKLLSTSGKKMETLAIENIATMVADFASEDPRYTRIMNMNLAVDRATVIIPPSVPLAPRQIVAPATPIAPPQAPQKKKKSTGGRDVAIGKPRVSTMQSLK